MADIHIMNRTECGFVGDLRCAGPAMAAFAAAASSEAAMEFAEVLRRRRMVPAFPGRAPRSRHGGAHSESALRAPSAGYSQGYGLLVLTERRTVNGSGGHSRRPTAAAVGIAAVRARNRARPVLVVAPLLITPISIAMRDLRGWVDRARFPLAGAVLVHRYRLPRLLMLLAAVDEGLGALLFGLIPADIPAFRSAFGVPGRPGPRWLRRHRSRSSRPLLANSRSRRRSSEPVVHRGLGSRRLIRPVRCHGE